ncbi:MAG: hypothetical protein V4549_10195 [Bacteroidota bacterium]
MVQWHRQPNQETGGSHEKFGETGAKEKLKEFAIKLSNVSRHAKNSIAIDLGKLIADGQFESIGQMTGSTVKSSVDLLTALMDPVYVASELNPIEEAEKCRRKKKKSLDQSQGLGR